MLTAKQSSSCNSVFWISKLLALLSTLCAVSLTQVIIVNAGEIPAISIVLCETQREALHVPYANQINKRSQHGRLKQSEMTKQESRVLFFRSARGSYIRALAKLKAWTNGWMNGWADTWETRKLVNKHLRDNKWATGIQTGAFREAWITIKCGKKN